MARVRRTHVVRVICALVLVFAGFTIVNPWQYESYTSGLDRHSGVLDRLFFVNTFIGTVNGGNLLVVLDRDDK